MRLLCIPLVLAVAIRPIGVHAHAKPSDMATTADQVEVQGHVRVKERANDKSDDERMSPVPDKFISTVLEDGVQLLKDKEVNSWDLEGMRESDSWIHKGTSDATNVNLNARKRKIRQLDFQKEIQREKAKRPKTQLSEFLKILDDAQTMEKNERSREYDYLVQNAHKTLFDQANEYFFYKKKDPTEVFELYLLSYPKEELFTKKQLLYWIDYLDNWKKTPLSLLKTLLTYYSIEELEIAMKRSTQRNINAMVRVANKLHVTFKHLKSPTDAYDKLGLDNIKENICDSPSFLYWMRYCSSYNSKKATKTLVLPILFKRYGKEKFLNDFKKFLKGFKGPDWTKDLEVEIEKAGIVFENE